VDRLKPSGKSFDISKSEVWEAYRQVRANRGAPGVDGVTLEQFDEDLKDNLYKIWNRLSSGSYFPPPVKAVEIPKPHGGGTRTLGVRAIAPFQHWPDADEMAAWNLGAVDGDIVMT
jgi:RNA-directed DNA polymerase